MLYLSLLFCVVLIPVIIKIAVGVMNIIRPLFSGWLTIPKRYRSKEHPLGTSFGVQSVELGFGDIPSMTFKSCVFIHLSKTDLYLEYIGMMSSFYPAIKLPIEKIEISRAHSMWRDAIKVRLLDSACPNFFFENPISDALYEAKINLSPEFG